MGNRESPGNDAMRRVFCTKSVKGRKVDHQSATVKKFVEELKRLPQELRSQNFVNLYKEWTESGLQSNLGRHLGQFVLGKQRIIIWLSSHVACPEPETNRISASWGTFSKMTGDEIIAGFMKQPSLVAQPTKAA
jgi:hypothetical protein